MQTTLGAQAGVSSHDALFEGDFFTNRGVAQQDGVKFGLDRRGFREFETGIVVDGGVVMLLIVLVQEGLELDREIDLCADQTSS